jgi:hypothetical protein
MSWLDGRCARRPASKAAVLASSAFHSVSCLSRIDDREQFAHRGDQRHLFGFPTHRNILLKSRCVFGAAAPDIAGFVGRP